MSLKEIKEFIREKQGYLKKSAQVLAERLNCGLHEAAVALSEVRLENKDEIGALSSYVETTETIHTEDENVKMVVKSRWQTPDGRWLYAYKNVANEEDTLIKEFEDFKETFLNDIKEAAPKVDKLDYEKVVSEPIVYEISIPDLHFGKGPLEDTVINFLETVKKLHKEAKGFNIEKFLLPIGNDGLNSEGARYQTTKGTPQFDYAEWQETFRVYWKALVSAIEYLLEFAPVDIIVVQGNHDFERMFYIGDVISAYYHNNLAVTVDNSFDSRKYYEYGNNMLMFTHGDKEKPADLPLIMADEKPDMWARCKYREAHLGHLHKEMVNDFRGIKVKFLPSICPNDAWHKTQGYSAFRCDQAHIWEKHSGYKGYLQINID